jgi:hypothetical protein
LEGSGKWRKEDHDARTQFIQLKKFINIYKKPSATRERNSSWVRVSWEQLRLPWLTQVFYYYVDWNDRESGGRKGMDAWTQFVATGSSLSHLQEVSSPREEDLIWGESELGTIETPEDNEVVLLLAD